MHSTKHQGLVCSEPVSTWPGWEKRARLSSPWNQSRPKTPEQQDAGVVMKWMPFRLHQTIHQELDSASNISEKQLNRCIHLMPDRLRYLKFSAANREMHHHTQKKDGS
jgi:hypothetical protein